MMIYIQQTQQTSSFDYPARHWRWPAVLVVSYFCLVGAVTGYGQRPPHGTISQQQFSDFGSGVEFDINLVRLYPKILDNQQFMRYFVALNNCGSPQIPQLLNNELDFPPVAAYYKSHAAEITSSLPPIVSVGLYGGARAHGDYRLLDTAKLGEYDVQRGAFPVITHQGISSLRPGDSSSSQSPATSSGNVALSLGSLFRKKPKTAPADSGNTNANEHHVIQMDGNFAEESVRDTLSQGCPAANSVVHLAGRQFGFLPHDYAVRTEPMGFNEVPMPESAAREYINKHPPTARGVMFVVFIRLLEQPPQVEQLPGRSDQSLSQASFSGKIAKVDVVDLQTGAVVASLMDDHSVPSFMDAQEAPKAPEGPESAVFMAHLPQMPPGAVKFQYTSIKRMPILQQSIDTVVAIAMEHDFCKWPIGPQAQHNVVDFLNDIQSDSAHNARIPIAAQMTQKRMDILGSQYCGNFQEKYRYQLMVNQMWPTGKLANPDAF